MKVASACVVLLGMLAAILSSAAHAFPGSTIPELRNIHH